MAQRLEQSKFSKFDFDDERLNLHTHSSPQKTLVLFVHGFCGSGYKTWGDFPRMLFDGDFGRAVDVATMDYPSGYRAASSRGADIDFYSSLLEEQLVEFCSTYENIYIIAHSLGGIVAGAAVQKYLQRASNRSLLAVTNVAAIVYFASPRAGSGWARPWLGFLIREFSWLKRFSDKIQGIEKFFDSNVQSFAMASTEHFRYLIPRYAALAAGDAMVNKFSAAFSIPEEQIKHMGGDHRSISKPNIANQAQVRWVNKIIEEVDEIRLQWRREFYARTERNRSPSSAPPTVVTELWTGPRGTDWVEAYNVVRSEKSDTSILIQDVNDAPAGQHPDLLISVHESDRVVSSQPGEEGRVRDACRRGSSVNATVGIAAVGPDFAQARERICEWTPSNPTSSRLLVEGSLDLPGLHNLIKRWIEAVISRDPRRVHYRRGLDRFLQTDSTEYDYRPTEGYL